MPRYEPLTGASHGDDSFEEFQRKQAAKHAAEPPPPSHNEPRDLPSLSHEEITYVEAAREALVTIKRTFEFWIVIARGLRALKDKAERVGGRFTFDRLREREGLGGRDKQGKEILNKTRVSRLLAILDNIADVEGWRATLTEKQRFDWASPEAVYRHCPVFAKPLDEGGEHKPSPYAQMKQANIALQEENTQLKQREDGDTFNAKSSSPREIALALFGQLTPYRGKAERVARELLALIKEEVTGAKEDERPALVWSSSGKDRNGRESFVAKTGRSRYEVNAVWQSSRKQPYCYSVTHFVDRKERLVTSARSAETADEGKVLAQRDWDQGDADQRTRKASKASQPTVVAIG